MNKKYQCACDDKKCPLILKVSNDRVLGAPLIWVGIGGMGGAGLWLSYKDARDLAKALLEFVEVENV